MANSGHGFAVYADGGSAGFCGIPIGRFRFKTGSVCEQYFGWNGYAKWGSAVCFVCH